MLNVHPLPMNPDVGLQRALGCETLSTDLAGERLLSWKEEKSCVHKLTVDG